VTREVELPAGTVIFEPGSPAAIYHVLSGDIQIDEDNGGSARVGAGSSIGVTGTLTRRPMGCRGRVAADTRLLHIDPEDLFDVLSNHSDLLQGVFSSVMNRQAPVAGR